MNYIVRVSSVLAFELCTGELRSWNSNPITRMKMTIKDMTTLFQESFQPCESCSYTVSFKRFVIDSFPLSPRSWMLTLRLVRRMLCSQWIQVCWTSMINFLMLWFDLQITSYFVALATPQTTQVVTVVDNVGGMEKLIQQSDVEGSTAVKLDLSLDTPIIIMPRSSNSQE